MYDTCDETRDIREVEQLTKISEPTRSVSCNAYDTTKLFGGDDESTTITVTADIETSATDAMPATIDVSSATTDDVTSSAFITIYTLVLVVSLIILSVTFLI